MIAILSPSYRTHIHRPAYTHTVTYTQQKQKKLIRKVASKIVRYLWRECVRVGVR